MGRHIRASLIVVLVPVLAVSLSRLSAQDDRLVLAHANVVDVRTGAILRNVTVVVEGTRISAVETAAGAKPPAPARVVDATGKYLIPGLWDMHIHWYDARFLPLFTANGVTGVRQMWGMPLHLGWRTQIARHGLLGPRFSIASAIFDGPNPVWKGSVVVTNANEARDAVREAKSAGYDFIKVYERLSKEAYLAIADEAKTQGVPFAGHVPLAVTTAEASAAGQRSIEHLSSVLYGTSSSEAESRPKAAQLSTGNEASVPMTVERRAALRAITETVLATYDKDKAAALFGAFVKNDTWQCPTLVVLRAFANLDDPAFTSDPRLKYMPRTIRDSWNPASDARTSTRTPEDYASGRRLFRRQLEVVDLMQKNGVRLLAGTDALNPFAFPGFSLHDELQLMVQAGLSPLEALRTATINPAIFLGRTDQLGAIEAGKLADLVLLDANPLDGIANTTRIALVVADGRVFTRADLDGMLAQAEKTANAGTSDRE